MSDDRYFLDTTFVIGLIFGNDTNHQRALNVKSVLNHDCYINNSVLAEIMNISNKYADFNTVVEIYYHLFDNFTIINEFDIFGYDARTLAEYQKYEGKLGFVDSGILTTMNQHQIPNIVTFDKQFKKFNSINVIF